MNSEESTKNSMSGTMPTKVTKARSQVKTLAPEEICAIIEACAKNGVATLKFGDLEIQRGPPATRSENPEAPASLAPTAHSNIPVAEMTDQQHEQQNANNLVSEELATREAQIAELLVTDPVAAEKLILEGELEDADNESGPVE